MQMITRKALVMLLLGGLLGLSFLGVAQVSLGPEFGANFSAMQVANTPNTASIGAFPGVSYGGRIDYAFNSIVALESGVVWKNIGFTSAESSLTTIMYKRTVSSIEVPLLLVFKIKTQPGHLLLFGGGYFNFGRSANVNVSGIPSGLSLPVGKPFKFGNDTNASQRSVDVGVKFGLGYAFKRFQIRGTFTFGLRNLIPQNDQTSATVYGYGLAGSILNPKGIEPLTISSFNGGGLFNRTYEISLLYMFDNETEGKQSGALYNLWMHLFHHGRR